MQQSPLPTLLYHYTDARGLLGIIESQAIWASNIRYLNDSQEFDYALTLAKMVIRDRARAIGNQKEKELLKVLSDGLTSGGRSNVFVASFCADDGDSLSQWRGYCPNGAGYSIGFVARDLHNEAGVQVIRLVECLYDCEAQRELIMQVLNEVMSSAEWTRALGELEGTELYQRAAHLWLQDFSLAAPFIKHGGFHKEREWRLITGPIPYEDPRWNVRPGRSMLIPYVPIKLAVVRGHLPLKEIVVGPTPHMRLAQQAVAEWLDRKGMCEWGLHNIPWTIRNSKIPYRNW
jgi:hypothetical protein